MNLISRRPAADPVHEFLFNRSTLGATDASMFLASPLVLALERLTAWAAAIWQERRDVDGDGWADLAGYSRGVIRPRFFWITRTAARRADGRHDLRESLRRHFVRHHVPGHGEPYKEALNTRRYDVGGNVQWLIRNRYVVTARFSHRATAAPASIRGSYRK